MSDTIVNPTNAGTEAASSLDILGANQTLGKEDFLQLLVTQLRHQDPLDPMDNTAFVSQLAEFSALEQMRNVNTTLGDLNIMMGSINNTLASQIIGKNVKFHGNTINFNGTDNADISYSLENHANVKINIYDEKNNLVSRIIAGDKEKGMQNMTWEGISLGGKALPAGKYTFEIQAVDQNGVGINSITYATERVRGMKFDEDGNTILLLDEKEIYLSDVMEILKATD